MAVEKWWTWEEVNGNNKWICGKHRNINDFLKNPLKGVDIEEIIGVLKERMGRSNYEEWCNIRSGIKNKGDVKSMKKNRCINVNAGDLVFWYDRKSGRVVNGKVAEISFCKGKGCIIIDSKNHLDYKSILFVIPNNFELDYTANLIDTIRAISSILQKQFEKNKEPEKPKEPEIKLYPFQEKIYSEIISQCITNEHFCKERCYFFIEMPPRTGKTTVVKKLQEYFEAHDCVTGIMNYKMYGLKMKCKSETDKCSVILVDDMQKSISDTSRDINELVLYTANCIKEYSTSNALIVFIGSRFSINDYVDRMRTHLVMKVANNDQFSLFVKKYPAWENSLSQCSPMLDYKTLKGIKEQIGEEKFSIMYLLKV
jgi:hypothetical protein